MGGECNVSSSVSMENQGGGTQTGRKLLVLDVGITTGYAVFFLDGRLHARGWIKPLTYMGAQNLLLKTMPSIIVVEFPVIVRGKLGTELEKVCQAVREVFNRQIREVTPSEWKQTPYAKTPCPRGASTHERDAIRIGRYFLGEQLKSAS